MRGKQCRGTPEREVRPPERLCAKRRRQECAVPGT